MPAKISQRALNILRSLAQRGDQNAEALIEIMDGTYWVEMTGGNEGDEAADTIRIFGQVKDQDQQDVAGARDVVMEALNGTAGDTLTLTVNVGTAKSGDGTTKVWLETNANGYFEVDVLLQNAGGSQAGDVLLHAMVDNGEDELTTLTFA